MRSSRGKASLRITEEDRRRLAILCSLQDRLSCCFAAPDEDENTDSRINVSQYLKEEEK